jgi:hypothetical protein
MIRFFTQGRNHWLIMAMVFGIGPLICYLMFIGPSLLRISNYQKRINLQIAEDRPIDTGPAPATAQELEQLEEIKLNQLAKIKKVGSRESLLNFSGTLADALAGQARIHGLRVISVDLQNSLIKGRYVPGSNHALEILAGMPGPRWNELADPLDLPMLNLPSTEILMTVAAEYSQVFSFIESLPDFPVPVSLSSLSAIDDSFGRAFQMKIRGFYYRNDKSAQVTQLETATSR